MTNRVSTLTVRLVDDVTGPAKRVAQALKGAAEQAKAIGKATAGSGLSAKFVGDLTKLGLSAKAIDKVGAAFRDYARSAGLAAKATDWTKAQAGQVRAWESATIVALRHVRREQDAFTSSATRAAAAARQLAAERSARRRDALGTVGAGAGLVAAHRGKELGKKAIVSAAEFDIGVRKQRAFTDITAAEQAPLIAQAKKIGQETPFSNLDVVKAQTKAMQGLPAGFGAKLKAEVAEGILENVKNYALVMEADLETSAEAVRSYLQTTGKDISTKEKALAEANKATNQLVKMAKLGGMSDEDVQQFMKFAASSGTTAGLSTETLMSLAALARRGGLRGDEAGTFIRSASSKMVSPTKQGRAALNAAGINFDDYVRMPGKLDAGRLETQFKTDMGVKFTPAVRARLDKILADPKIIGDRGAFTTAVTEAVSEQFQKTKKGTLRPADRVNIAKAAGTFQKLSAGSVDTERLLDDAMQKGMTLAQLNAWLTDKHGGKGAITQRQWDEFKASREEIRKTGDDPDFAKRKADEIMGGLGGSFENLKGSVENLILSLGTANEGLLKLSFDKAGAALDAISNMSEPARQVATGLGLIAGTAVAVVSGLKLAGAVLGVGGPAAALTGSAAALTGSAEALTAAAARLGAGGAAGAAGAGAGAAATAGAAGAPTLLGRAGALASRLGAVLGPLFLLRDIGEAKRPMTPAGAPYRLDQKIDPGTWERAQRGVMEHRRDPEGRRGREMMRAHGPLGSAERRADDGAARGLKGSATEARAALDLLDDLTLTPTVDDSQVEALGTKAEATKEKLGALNTTVKPNVDNSALATTDSLLGSILGKMAQIKSEAGALRSSLANVGGLSTGKVRAATSGAFSD